MPNEQSQNDFSGHQGKLFVVAGILLTLLMLAVAYLLLDSRRVKLGSENGKPSGGGNNVPTSLTPQAETDAPAFTGPQVQITSVSDPATGALIERVFKHIFLPSGNVRVETVVNAEELRKVNPIFYQFAKPGDKVLIYTDRAILYDPVADRVLDVIHTKG